MLPEGSIFHHFWSHIHINSCVLHGPTKQVLYSQSTLAILLLYRLRSIILWGFIDILIHSDTILNHLRLHVRYLLHWLQLQVTSRKGHFVRHHHLLVRRLISDDGISFDARSFNGIQHMEQPATGLTYSSLFVRCSRCVMPFLSSRRIIFFCWRWPLRKGLCPRW